MILPLSHLPFFGLSVWPTFGLGAILAVQAAVMLRVWRTRRDPAPVVIVFAALTLGAAIGSQILYSIMGGAAGAIVGVICVRRLLPAKVSRGGDCCRIPVCHDRDRSHRLLSFRVLFRVTNAPPLGCDIRTGIGSSVFASGSRDRRQPCGLQSSCAPRPVV